MKLDEVAHVPVPDVMIPKNEVPAPDVRMTNVMMMDDDDKSNTMALMMVIGPGEGNGPGDGPNW